MAIPEFLLDGRFRAGWRRWAVWSFCILATLVLGTIRVATDAEFASASLALLPVLLISWVCGTQAGLTVSVIAATMWPITDSMVDKQFSATWVPWVNWLTRLATYSLVAVLVALVRRQLVKEREQATHDALTGLKNRRAFLQDGVDEINRSLRHSSPLTVIFLDLDDFKQLNDTRGHDAGDRALRETGKALVRALRSTDRVARLAGDEFAILLPEVSFEAAIETGNRLVALLKEYLAPFPPVTASIGVAWFPVADRSFPEMLKAADELMYAVKSKGKGSVETRRFGET